MSRFTRTKGRRDRLVRFFNSPITRGQEAIAYGGAPWASPPGVGKMNATSDSAHPG